MRPSLRRYVIASLGSASSYGVRAWLLVVLPITISLSILLSIGPSLQQYMVALLSSDQPSIYGSAYAESLIAFPTVGEWVASSLHPLFLGMAIIIATFAVRSNRFTGIVVRLGLLSFLVLSTVDISAALIGGRFNLSESLTDIVANFAGSIVIAVLMSALLRLFEIIADWQQPALARALMPAASAMVIASLFVSLVAYLCFQFFYRPMPVDLEITAKPQISGAYALRRRAGASFTPVQLLPEMMRGGSARIISPGGHLRARWDRGATPVIYDARVDLYADCIDRDPGKLPPSPDPIIWRNVSTLSASFDAGLSDISIGDDGSGRYTYADTPPVLYWITDTADGIGVQYFADGKAVLHRLQADTVDYYLSASLARTDGKVSYKISRTVTVTADGVTIRIQMPKPTRFDPKQKLRCTSLPTGSPTGLPGRVAIYKKPFLPPSTVIGGIRVRLTPRSTPAIDAAYPRPTTFVVSRMNGWVAIEKLNKDDFRNRSLGTADFLVFKEGLTGLVVDGAKVGVSPDAKIVALGSFDGRVTKAGEVRYSGTAQAIWKDRKRVNPTKWERLSIEIQLFILSTLVGLPYGLFRMARPVLARLKTNDPLTGL